MAMTHSKNGKTIKILIKDNPQLPDSADRGRPMLTGPGRDHRTPERAGADSGQGELESERRRAERQAERRLREERVRLLHRLLRVADHLEQAVAHVEKDRPVQAGLQLILDDLLNEMAQEGVAPISALGQVFDPHLHEAIATDGSGGDRVIEVLRTGYLLEGKLLRPARVVVGSLSP
jgi:molecular chaperone GrpE (heat shock protein)